MCDDFNDDLWDALTTFAGLVQQEPHEQQRGWVLKLVNYLGWGENMAQLMVARNERDRLRNALQGMWDQFAYTSEPSGTRHTGGLSALEDAADALGIETA